MKKIILIVIGMFSFISAQTVPNLPIPICSGTAEVINDSIYFFGGANRWAGTIRYSTVYKFDGNSWSLYDSIPDNSVWGIESVVVGNDVYLFAGWPSGASLVRRYNVLDKTWSYLTPSSNTVEFGVTVEYVSNKIYLFNTTGSVREYDITNDSWQIKTSNTLPAYALSSVVYQDEIYFAGFYDSTFYKYNPSADQWTQLGYFPLKVTKCAMEVIGDKIYCAGGSIQGNPSEQYDSLLVYDIVSDTWSIDQFELSGKRVWMADVTYNNKFYVLGGLDTTGFAVDIVEEIIPEGVLPVELVSFTCDVKNNYVELNWTTATEVNNYGFEIQKSNSNKEIWKKIDFIEGHGNSNSPEKYSFIDRDIIPGITSYRLKQIDFDGSYEYSNEIGATIPFPNESVLEQNCPNPFNPTTKISWQSPAGNKQTLKVYDVLGNEVATLVDEYKPAGKHEIEFNAGHLPSGVYFYQLQSGELIQTKKLMLLK